MSDTMLLGVLNMPPKCWAGDPLDQMQRHNFYKEAAERICRDAARITELESAAVNQALRIKALEKALEVPQVWSKEETDVLVTAFNNANEKHGWYETLFAVGAALLRYRQSKSLMER